MNAGLPAPNVEPPAALASTQQQFLSVISRDEAEARFHEHLTLVPLGTEQVPLSLSLRRILAEDVVAPVDVPGFDRSNVDGFAVRSADTVGASEDHPRTLTLTDEQLSPGIRPTRSVNSGLATAIATGGMLPRGADAVLMVEDTDLLQGELPWRLSIRRSAGPGENVFFAGSDIACGETVLPTGQQLSSREIGILAAIGKATVAVYRRPRVAILSTGGEIVAPGNSLPAGSVYDSNAAILSAAVNELGGEPICLGIVPDREELLQQALNEALQYDLVLLSGGTSKGAGDLSYRVVNRLGHPGIVAHGVALKPGKPVCLAVIDQKPIAILPGFPTSAIFTFHEFVAPVLLAFGGRSVRRPTTLTAELPMPINSQRGRTEYLLVTLLERGEDLAAYPLGAGSGSVTTFSRADGFITIDAHTEMIRAGEMVQVSLLGQSTAPADLVVMTSQCSGLDYLLGLMSRRGFSVKVMLLGSQAALAAARRAECDIAGMHLLDPVTNEYNRPFVTDDLVLRPGYQRLQCLVARMDDLRFSGKLALDAVRDALHDATCRMVNRNVGSGTRIGIDALLTEADPTAPRPPGYSSQVRSHHAACAAVKDRARGLGDGHRIGRATVWAADTSLREEMFDFVISRSRLDRPAVQAFCELLENARVRSELADQGYRQAQP